MRVSALNAESERVLTPYSLDEALAVFVCETKALHPEDSPREGYAKKLVAFAEDRMVAEDWRTVRY